MWDLGKHLDVLANACRLFKASAFPSNFKLYFVLVWGVLLYLSMSSGFNLTNQYDSIKYLTIVMKERKTPTGNRIWGQTTQNNPQRTRRVETYPGRRRCVSSTYDICTKQLCFKGCFYYSTSQDKKLLLMIPFLESQWRHMCVTSGVCLSVFVTARQKML